MRQLRHGTKVAVVLAIFFLLSALGVQAGEVLREQNDPKEIVGPVQATVLNVKDGDTVDVIAAIWLGQTVRTSVRLLGIDTPELRGDCLEEVQKAEEARDYLRSQVPTGAVVSLSSVRYDKYGQRVVGQVSLPDGRDLSQMMIEHRFARPVGVGAFHRVSWCGAS